MTARGDYLPQIDRAIPRIRAADTYLGMIGIFDPNQVYRITREVVEDTGSPSITHFMGRPNVYVGTPEHAREVVTKLKEKPASMRKSAGPFLGDESVVLVPHEKWVPLRRNLGQVFHLLNMKSYFGVFVDSAHDFVARIEEHNAKRGKHFEDAKAKGLKTQPTTLLEPIDVDRCAMDLALDVVTRALFSKNLAFQKGDSKELSINLARATHLFMKVLNPIFWLLHPFQYREYHRMIKWCHNLCLKWIKERQADPNNETKDLLALMLKARDPETGNPLTTEEIVSQSFTFYFAGHDTTGHTIAWTLYEIAQHPEVEEKVHEELARVLGDKDAPSYEEAGKLTYLQWVIKETLRIHPPVGSFSRFTTETTDIAGVTLPADCNVTVSILAVHNSELVWPEPWRFRPERFSEEESEGRDQYAWMPFSVGERNCIGINFAIMEVRTVVAVLCQKYLVRPSVDLLPHTQSFITSTPVDGIYLHFLPREK